MSNKNIKSEYFIKSEMKVDINVFTEMRDGVKLFSDVYAPAKKGKYPVLLSRIPYGKHKPRYHSLYMDPLRAVLRGYVVVIQDVRGKHSSEGEFNPFVNEYNDGYDTLSWISDQEWCDGNVGMFGISYHGATQWLAAATQHPSLKTIIPGVTSDSYYDSWTYLGGVLQYYWLTHWTVGTLILDDVKRNQDDILEREKLSDWILQNINARNIKTPLSNSDLPPFKNLGNFYHDWINNDSYNEFWKKISPKEYFDKINIPVFNMGGWYDGFLRGTLRCFEGMINSSEENVSDVQNMILGPWTHEPMPKPLAGAKHFGNKASGESIDIQGMMLDWYDYWLKNYEYKNKYRVQYYTMLENQWKQSYMWPPENTKKLKMYIHSDGNAEKNFNGDLNFEKPGKEKPDEFIYNPADPVITIGGAHLGGIPGSFDTGVHNQSEVENRLDVLTYTTKPIKTFIEISGNVFVNLYAKSSAEDTDWTARLCYVDHNNNSWNICDGIIRSSFSESFEIRKKIEPETITKYKIDLGPISIKLNQGMKLRLQISSSNFPAYETSTNLMQVDRNVSPIKYVIANQSIYHDNKFATNLEFDGLI